MRVGRSMSKGIWRRKSKRSEDGLSFTVITTCYKWGSSMYFTELEEG